MTVKEVRAWLNLSAPKVYELMHAGELVSFKIGRARRISRASVEGYLEKCRERPA